MDLLTEDQKEREEVVCHSVVLLEWLTGVGPVSAAGRPDHSLTAAVGSVD